MKAIWPRTVVSRAKTLARRVLALSGYEIRNIRRSTVFDDPYEALFAQHPRIVFTFPTSLCVDKLGFSYGRWQPWVATVRQLIACSRPFNYQQSVVKAFYDAWSFPVIESVFAHRIADEKVRNHFLKLFHGGFLPFSDRLGDDVDAAITKSTVYLDCDNRDMGSQLSMADSLRDDGTWSDAKGEIELKRLNRVLSSIGSSGYHRNDGPDGDIQGYLLRRSGTLRFVIDWGLHRASVLCALGHERLIVRLHRSVIVDLDSLPSWPLVKQGVWPREAAAQYFDHLFQCDSEEWAHSNLSGLCLRCG